MVERNLRIVFMGTPAFAVPSLQILMEAGYPIAGVITSTDKTGGRGNKEILVSAVKKFALDNNLKLLQPDNLKSKEFLNELRELKADLHVVVAFRMLPEAVWNMPRFGTMNLHGSLLPAYRGAAPINWAIIKGETTTGLTTFFLKHEIDTGHIISQKEMPILEEDDAGTLHDRMMIAGAGLVLGSVDMIATRNIATTPQNDDLTSHAPKIHHQDGHIDWKRPAREIQNLIRGMSPYPGAWTMLDGKELKIFKARKYSDLHTKPAGTLTIEKRLIVQAKDGEMEIIEVQQSGKKRMSAEEFLRGYKVKDWQLT